MAQRKRLHKKLLKESQLDVHRDQEGKVKALEAHNFVSVNMSYRVYSQSKEKLEIVSGINSRKQLLECLKDLKTFVTALRRLGGKEYITHFMEWNTQKQMDVISKRGPFCFLSVSRPAGSQCVLQMPEFCL